MAEQIKETDTLNQGRVKINAAIDLANESSEKVDSYKTTLDKGVADAKKIATDAGEDAKQIATEAGSQANQKADKAIADSTTALNTANNAMSRANQNKQEFDALENEFQDLVAESGDSNPEIVQARTDTQGIKQTTLQSRLTKDFSERMTTADAVQMFSGPINTPKMMDFSGKTAGNTSSNPHVSYSDNTATSLKKPSAVWNEMSQDNYNKLAGRDDSGVSTGANQNSVIPQQREEFDILATVKQLAPNIFTGLDTSEAVQYVKDNFVAFSLSVRAKASSPNNKVLKVATYLESTDSYSTQIQETAVEYSDFKIDINDSNFISSDGKLNVLVYSDSSNGVTAALVDVDYIGIQLTISLNPLSVLETSGFAKREYVDKEIAPLASTADLTAHTENKLNPHGVTKAQVQLSNVENYGIATEEEAEAGESSTKYMTPLRVFQAIAKWIGDKFVKKTGDETIAGTKDFQSVPTINGVPVALDTGTAYKEVTVPTDANFNGGTVFFWRIGNLVICSMSFQTKGYVGWKNMIEVPEGFRAQQSAGASTVLGSSSVAGTFGTIYTSGTNLQVLTQSGAAAGNYKGTLSWYTVQDFPR